MQTLLIVLAIVFTVIVIWALLRPLLVYKRPRDGYVRPPSTQTRAPERSDPPDDTSTWIALAALSSDPGGGSNDCSGTDSGGGDCGGSD